MVYEGKHIFVVGFPTGISRRIYRNNTNCSTYLLPVFQLHWQLNTECAIISTMQKLIFIIIYYVYYPPDYQQINTDMLMQAGTILSRQTQWMKYIIAYILTYMHTNTYILHTAIHYHICEMPISLIP